MSGRFRVKPNGPALLGGTAWNLCAIIPPTAVAVASVPFLVANLDVAVLALWRRAPVAAAVYPCVA